jgi:hypothetical protein
LKVKHLKLHFKLHRFFHRPVEKSVEKLKVKALNGYKKIRTFIFLIFTKQGAGIKPEENV